jgi:ribonuclease P protein component
MNATSTAGQSRLLVLNSSQDIKSVRQDGKVYSSRNLVLIVKVNELELNRYAIIASRSVGGAVERNRCKRRIRARMTKLAPRLIMGNDLLIIARSALLTISSVALDQAFEQMLVNARLLDEND